MNLKHLLTFFACCCLTVTLHARYVVQHSIDTAKAKWYGKAKVVTLPDGLPAATWTVPKATKEIWGLVPGNETPELSSFDTLTFDYMLSSPKAWFGLKLTDAPLVDGYDATWPIETPEDADKYWKSFTADINTPPLVWGERPSMKKRHVNFRIASTKQQETTVFIRNIRLKKYMVLMPANPTTIEWKNDTTFTLTFPIENRLETPLEGTLVLESEAIVGKRVTASVSVPAKAKRTFTVQCAIDASTRKPTPLTPFLCKATVADNQNVVAASASFNVMTPLPKINGPSILFTDAALQDIRKRIKHNPDVAKWWTGFQKKVDRKLNNNIELPPRGGQWWHYYSCSKCGSKLQTETPVKHVCKSCKATFTGWPYDDCFFYFQHHRLATDALEHAIAYAISKDEKYARKAAEILVKYSHKYESYPLHDVKGKPVKGGGYAMPQVLDESVWIIKLAQAYDTVRQTLLQDEKNNIEQKLLFRAASYIKSVNHGIHNHECWHLAAYGIVGLALNRADYVYDAIYGKTGFLKQIEIGTSEDGPWFEGAWGYHFYTLSALEPFHVALRNHGINLDMPKYQAMYKVPFDYLTPTFQLPAFHDTGRMGFRPHGTTTIFEAPYAWWNSSLHAWWLGQAKRTTQQAAIWGKDLQTHSEQPTFKSFVHQDAGFAVLRSYSPILDKKPIPHNYVAIDFGKHGGWHGHMDKLSYVLWAGNTMFAEDPGCISYGNKMHHEWYRSTVSHNTIMLDDKDQAQATGTCTAFASDNNATIASFDAGPVYPDATIKRHLALLDDCLIDVMTVHSPRKRNITWLFHARNNGKTDYPGTPMAKLPPLPGAKWAKNWHEQPHDGTWSATWTREHTTLALAQVSPKGTILSADGPAQPPPQMFHCRFNRVHADNAIFASVFAFNHDKSKKLPVITEAKLLEHGAITVTAIVNGRTFTFIAAPDGNCTTPSLNIKAKAALLEQKDTRTNRLLIAD